MLFFIYLYLFTNCCWYVIICMFLQCQYVQINFMESVAVIIFLNVDEDYVNDNKS